MDKEDKTSATADPMTALCEGEVRILPADYALKKIVGEDVDASQLLGNERMEKAQQVIQAHKEHFLDWVLQDIGLLEDAYAKALATMPHCEAEIRRLARAAFIIKSQAGTFGFDLATDVAKSLDDFCNRDFVPTPAHLTVVRKHIDTLIGIFRENITGDGGRTGRELTETLSRLIARYAR